MLVAERRLAHIVAWIYRVVYENLRVEDLVELW